MAQLGSRKRVCRRDYLQGCGQHRVSPMRPVADPVLVTPAALTARRPEGAVKRTVSLRKYSWRRGTSWQEPPLWVGECGDSHQMAPQRGNQGKKCPSLFFFLRFRPLWGLPLARSVMRLGDRGSVGVGYTGEPPGWRRGQTDCPAQPGSHGR